VTPQRKGVIPDDHAQALTAALAERDQAQVDLDAATDRLRAAVTAALIAGGSVREVAAFTGLSRVTVEKWGRAGGWPSAEQRERWEAEKQANAEWRAKSEAARKFMKHMEGGDDE
jgi:transposase